jgi:hypothetical protein
MRTRSAILALGAAVLIAGCGSSAPATHRSKRTAVASSAQVLRRLRRHLPYGFDAPGHAVKPGAAAADLSVAPARTLAVSQIHLQPLPSRRLLGEAVAGVINEPGPMTLRAIFTSATSVAPGAQLTVAGNGLGPARAALLVLDGPGGRYQHLIALRDGVGAAVATLPAGLARGEYFIVIDTVGAPSGEVYADVGRLAVS